MKNFTIAVVIPAFNVERYIGETLDSVTAQTRLPTQIVVVDDGSTDGTAERVLSWKRENFPGLIFRQQNHQGVSAARNTGIRHADADLIAFLDADDLFLTHQIEWLESAFKRYPELVVCFGDAAVFGIAPFAKPSVTPGTGYQSLDYEEQEDGLRVIKGSAYDSLLRGNYIHTSACLVSKSAIEQVGYFDEQIGNAEDRDLFLRLSRVGAFANYLTAVARKRVHAASLTATRPIMLTLRHQFLVLQKMLDHAEELELSENERQRTLEAMFEQVGHLLSVASSLGVVPYLKTIGYLSKRQKIMPMVKPRDFLRAVVSSLSLYRSAEYRHWK